MKCISQSTLHLTVYYMRVEQEIRKEKGMSSLTFLTLLRWEFRLAVALHVAALAENNHGRIQLHVTAKCVCHWTEDTNIKCRTKTK